MLSSHFTRIPIPQLMRQICLLAALLTIVQFSFARVSQGLPETFSTSMPAQEMLSEIMGVVGLTANFELREAKVPNIQASISHRKRYILYNPDYISWINNATNDKWAAIALMAHEVGHHLNGHTIRRSGSKPVLELEADEFAGFVLHKLGASLEQAQEVMLYIAETVPSRTHPSRTSRMLAIQQGWNKSANSSPIIAKAKK